MRVKPTWNPLAKPFLQSRQSRLIIIIIYCTCSAGWWSHDRATTTTAPHRATRTPTLCNHRAAPTQLFIGVYSIRLKYASRPISLKRITSIEGFTHRCSHAAIESSWRSCPASIYALLSYLTTSICLKSWRAGEVETQSFYLYTASRRHIRKAIKLYQVRWTRVTHAADNCIECTRRCPCVGCNTLSRHTRRSWRIWNTTPKHLSDDGTAQLRSPSNIFRACKVYWFWLRNSIK